MRIVKWFQVLLSNTSNFIHQVFLCNKNNLHTVSKGCRIQWLHLCRGLRTPPHECPSYETKQSDGEVPVIPEFLGMQSTPSLPLFPALLCPRMVALDRVLSMGQIQLNCALMLKWIAWNRTVLKFKLRTYNKLNCSR